MKYYKFTNAFKNSAYNVLDSVKYYVANSNFIQIPEEGISIKDLDISKVVIFSELMIEKMVWGIILSWGLGNFYQLREKKEYN